MGLHVAPQTRPLAKFLRGRSAGLHDLDHGHRSENDALDDVDLLAIAGILTDSASSLLGALVGDTIVRPTSALGRGRGRALSTNAERIVGGRVHFSLMDAVEVRAEILAWLDTDRQ